MKGLLVLLASFLLAQARPESMAESPHAEYRTITDPTRSRRSAETVGEHVVNKAGMIGTRIGFFSGPDTYWPA
ncbi:uncharacterized protein LOC114363457 isoform X2 [Ostrinia furnacalis]|uniref:uncharacterized protein LOC114363457 isoform X2 n=1 Tax=Ostrinia furnacalis TaxID=93504 RepID=UPI00103FB30D|nr:uncharacterized protein LOC114363457 isoform X2 [Ostrinia furnacalis]